MFPEIHDQSVPGRALVLSLLEKESSSISNQKLDQYDKKRKEEKSRAADFDAICIRTKDDSLEPFFNQVFVDLTAESRRAQPNRTQSKTGTLLFTKSLENKNCI